MKHHYSPQQALPYKTRFWLKVWPRGDCWEWRGGRNRAGYGFFYMGDDTGTLAHRQAYEMAKGTIPPGHQIDHLCRHKWCVKPSHLEAVSPRTNALRSDGLGAINAQKTHCPHGHPFKARTRGEKSRPEKLRRYCPICNLAYAKKGAVRGP